MPSAFALQRLIDLGAPLNGKARVLGSVQREFATRSTAADGEFVLAAGRLTPEKGFEDVLEACRAVNLPLVIAGDGPQKAELEAQGHATFVGHVAPAELRALRQRAAVAVVPSRYAEILPLAALEAMAAGLPTVAAASGGLTEAVPEEGLYPAGDTDALAERLRGCSPTHRPGSALWPSRAPAAPPTSSPTNSEPCTAQLPPPRGIEMRMKRRLLPFLLLCLAVLLVPASAHAAKSQKKVIWGPIEIDGESQFPVYKDLGRRHVPDAARVGQGRRAGAAGREGPGGRELRVVGRDRHRHLRGQGQRHQVALSITGKPSWAERERLQGLRDRRGQALQGVRTWAIGDGKFGKDR